MIIKEQIGRIKQLIALNKNSEVFELLFKLLQEFDEKDLENAIIMKSADFNDLKERQRNGLMRYEDYLIARSNINLSILSILSDIEKIEETQNKTQTIEREKAELKEKLPKNKKLNFHEIKIEKRKIKPVDSNFVFIFGNIGVGKTTLLASIAELISSHPNTILRYNLDNQESTKFLIDKIDKIQNNKFPERSTVGLVHEINIGIESIDTSEITNFTLLEMSGEDLISFNNYSNNDKKNYPKNIEKYVKASKLFLVITSVENAIKDDLFIYMFIENLRKHFDKLRIALVITKFDLLSEDLSVEKFCIENLPITKKALSSGIIESASVFPFSAVKHFESKNFYTRNIVSFLYDEFSYKQVSNSQKELNNDNVGLSRIWKIFKK